MLRLARTTKPKTNTISLLLALALTMTAFVALAQTALANTNQESIMMDDRLFAEPVDYARQSALDDAATLGVDTIHSLVIWNRIAPRASSTKKPKGFDATNPADYSPEVWDGYDGLVRDAKTRGFDVILVPVLRGPFWASQCKGSQKKINACNPSPTEYAKFVQAVGKRYSGTYRDENQAKDILPRVRRWSISNEPNIAGWLYPQSKIVKGQIIPQSPINYRKAVYKAAAALKKTGHSTATDQIFLFEGGPVGRTTGPLAKRTMAPALFLRELFCLDPNGRPYTGAAAKVRSCTGQYKKLPIDAMAHHPYTRGAANPPLKKGNLGDITYANLSTMSSIMNQGAAHQRIPGALPLYLTEYGIQTIPPETSYGQTLENQARFLNQADYIAYKNSRVKSVAQYQLADEPPTGPFQTGIRFTDFSKKPAWDAYRVPIYVVQAGAHPKVYGQVRPAIKGATESIAIQRADTKTGTFTTVKEVTVANKRGNFYVDVTQSGGYWRLAWTPSTGGTTIYSRVAEEERR